MEKDKNLLPTNAVLSTVIFGGLEPKYKKGDLLEISMMFEMGRSKSRHGIPAGTIVEVMSEALPFQTVWDDYAYEEYKGKPCYYCKTPDEKQIILLEAELMIPN